MVQLDKQFECEQCGAALEFQPGSQALACPYCGHENAIAAMEAAVEELDYHAALARAADTADTEERLEAHCTSCGALSTLGPNVAADECPFCGTPIVKAAETHRVLKPGGVLPFKIRREDARAAFRDWIQGLWFAPNTLKRRAKQTERLQGVYIPYWTYDCHAGTRYTGQRGEHYWVTEMHPVTVNGKTQMRARQVRKTRWYPASGHVQNNFDDVLVLASESLPKAKTDALEPWDLKNVAPYQDDYLSGFKAESYRVGLEAGFEHAKYRMDPVIRATIRRDIGGDEQRIHQCSTQYSNITFKHILLPIWISAYRYHNRIYRFLVNGRTGEVQGERPWSWVKITFAVLAGLLIAGGIYLATQM
ncbi:MAG: hypothetical protein KF886_16045 [Candidatus Hydrogenedentes bacterium]|nr:hypothetical protein [Candidatus Hydrogenedentota bacterium]